MREAASGHRQPDEEVHCDTIERERVRVPIFAHGNINAYPLLIYSFGFWRRIVGQDSRL